jgi:hypothetical protein
MTLAERTEYVTRDTIMKLLSDEEIAKVSNAETATNLEDGAEYVDLENIDKGVQSSKAATKVAVGNVLPRTAVSAEAWSKIVAQLAR